MTDTESPATEPRDLLTELSSGVATLTLNRPDRRNALSRSLVSVLTETLNNLAADPTVRVIVLKGAEGHFCAGADIGEFVTAAADGLARSDAEGVTRLLKAMVGCPQPVVAQVEGAAFGGGVGVICAADLAIATSSARFSLSEARLGLVAAVIAPYVFAALGPRETKAKVLLGSQFDAAEALRIGLVHQVVEPENIDEAVAQVTADLRQGAPGSLATIKKMPAMVQGDPETVRAAMVNLLTERLGSEEGREGLRAFLDRRPPAWAVEADP